MSLQYPVFTPNTNIYMLLDGAKINELGWWIYTVNNEVDGTALYAGTPLADVLSLSPWLLFIKDVEAFLPLIEKIQNNGAGLLIESSAGLEEMIEFWQMRLFAKLPEGQEIIFRLYEPSVLAALLSTVSSSEKGQLMGPNDVIWYWNEQNMIWQDLIREVNKPSQLEEAFRLTQEHLITLTQLKQHQCAAKLYSHIKRYFPDAITHKEQGDELVKSLLEKAVSLGFSTSQALFYFSNIWASLGSACLDTNIHPEISSLLTQNSQLSHATRIERAAMLASKIMT